MKKKTVWNKVLWLVVGAVFLEVSLRAGAYVYLEIREASNPINSSHEVPEGEADRGANVYRILCLGESTTAGDGVTSWPEQLEEVLNSRSHIFRFEVFNAGVAGTNTAFILSRLEDNLEKYDPHIVISMMGMNDGDALHVRYDAPPAWSPASVIGALRIVRLFSLIWDGIKSTKKESVEVRVVREKDHFIKRLDRNEEVEFMTRINQLIRQNRFDEIVAAYERALQEHPDSDWLYYGLGEYLFIHGRKDDSVVKLFEKVVELNPNQYNAHDRLGQIYRERMEWTKAVALFQEALRIDPNVPDAFFNLVECYSALGKKALAKEMLKKAIELDFQHDRSLHNFVVGQFRFEEGFAEELESISKKTGISVVPVDPSVDTTRYHYRKLYEILNSRNIMYIAMQYPLLDVDEIKRMFVGTEEIVFVSNRENFSSSLRHGSYEEYFIDRCYKTFGHATPKGDILIAENLASAILKKLGFYSPPDPTTSPLTALPRRQLP